MNKKTILVFAMFVLAVFVVENIHPVSAFNWNDGSLQAYYKLDDSAGNGGSILDSVSGNYIGTNFGAHYGASGKINTAYNFVQSDNNYINTGFGLGQTFSAMTLSAWVKSSDTDAADAIVGTRSPGDLTGQSFASLYLGGGLLAPCFSVQKYGAQLCDFNHSINDNQWHFLVGTYNSTTAAIYLDGALMNSTTGSYSPFTPSNNFYIGWDDYNTAMDRFYNGTIDEVGIWSRALTASEVQQLYNNGSGLAASIIGPPIAVSLISPANNTYNSSIFPTYFTGTIISNNNTLKNVTVIVDGVGNFTTTNTSGVNNTIYSFFQPLSEGNHTWTIQACDVNSYCYTPSSRIIVIDKTAPLMNFITPPDNYTNNTGSVLFGLYTNDTSAVNVSLFSSYGNNSTRLYNTGNYYYLIYSFPNGVYQWYMTACDLAGNCNSTANRTLTVSYTPSSGGSSGGGSSGGGGGGGVSVTVSQSSGGGTTISIQANQPIILNVSNSSTSITQVQIVSNQNSSNASITVSPSSVPSQISVGGQTYQTFQITLGGLEEASIINVSIDFKINKSWMENSSKDPANVTLFRNTGTDSTPIWTGLLTNLTSQDSDYYYYQSISPGFSTYAVVVGNSSCITGQSRCLANDMQECGINQKWTTIKTCSNGCNFDRCLGEVSSLLSGNNVYYFSAAFILIIGGVVFFIIYRHHKNK